MEKEEVVKVSMARINQRVDLLTGLRGSKGKEGDFARREEYEYLQASLSLTCLPSLTASFRLQSMVSEVTTTSTKTLCLYTRTPPSWPRCPVPPPLSMLLKSKKLMRTHISDYQSAHIKSEKYEHNYKHSYCKHLYDQSYQHAVLMT